MSDIFEITYGKRIFRVELHRFDRKRLTITVYPDLKIIAKVPLDYEDDIIQKRLSKRASWIARQVDFFTQYHPQQPPREYVSGETHYYLGRQYRLKIIEGQQPRVRLKGRYFLVETPSKSDREKVKNQMQNWFTDHARGLLRRRIQEHLPTFTRLGAKEPIVIYRRMKKRWGSCSKTGKIVLNTELVKAPLSGIDYVIFHELCHLLFPKHDVKFFRLLSSLMPDWENRKEILERTEI